MDHIIKQFAADAVVLMEEVNHDSNQAIKVIHDSAAFLCLKDIEALCEIISDTSGAERVQLLKELSFKLKLIRKVPKAS